MKLKFKFMEAKKVVERWRKSECVDVDYDLLQRKFKSYRFNIYLLSHVSVLTPLDGAHHTALVL